MKIKWIKTLLTLLVIALFTPELIDYMMDNYKSDEIREWWKK